MEPKSSRRPDFRALDFSNQKPSWSLRRLEKHSKPTFQRVSLLHPSSISLNLDSFRLLNSVALRTSKIDFKVFHNGFFGVRLLAQGEINAQDLYELPEGSRGTY